MPTPDGRTLRPHSLTTAQKYRVAVAAVIAAQAGWLGALASRGWFYQDDFIFLSQATRRRFGWGYLSEPLNDHLVPGLRAAFWLMQHFLPFNHTATVWVRVILQAVATALLYLLLRTLTGRTRRNLYFLAVYSFSPLLVPGVMWLSTSANVLCAQIFVLTAYLCHVRHAVTRQLRWAALTGLSLLLATCFWEKSAVTAMLLVLLSLGWLTSGTARQRVAALVADWVAWLVTFGPLAAFVGYFVLGGYGSAGNSGSLRAAPRLAAFQWYKTVWPAAVGGPWRWYSNGGIYASLGNPTRTVEIIGQAAFALMLWLGYRRVGHRVWLAWSLPLVSVAVGMALVGLGRYALFGDLVPLGFSYAFDVAIPMVLAAALSLSAAAPPGLPRKSVLDHASRPTQTGSSGRARRWPALVSLAIIASSTFSTLTWVHRWGENPAPRYVHTLIQQVRAAGPGVNLYDTGVPLNVVPFVGERRDVSDILAIAGVPARFNQLDTDPQLVDDGGHLRPATLLIDAQTAVTPNKFCDNLIQGRTDRTLALTAPLTDNKYFVRISYFQNRETEIEVRVRDSAGKKIAAVGGDRIALTGTLGAHLIELSNGRPSTVEFSSLNAATNTCITETSVGVPFVKR
jgi:hypothetical protein